MKTENCFVNCFTETFGCFWKERKEFKNSKAKMCRDDLEITLERHINNLKNCNLFSIHAVKNSALILENKLLKIKEELETASPQVIGGDFGWLMLRWESQYKHISEFIEFSEKINWDEFIEENHITPVMVHNLRTFGLNAFNSEDVIGEEVNMVELLRELLKARYKNINIVKGYIIGEPICGLDKKTL